MKENKQIEEIAKTCPYNVRGECALDETRCTTDCEVAQWGYRKASEVAREIFEGIERLLDNYHSACLPIGEIEAYVYYEGGLGDEIAELKKKYESEDTK